MKKFMLVLTAFIGFAKNGVGQTISLPRFYPFEDTVNYFYLSTCEEYQHLFQNYKRYGFEDSCEVDFTKYDVEGIREHDTLKWSLVQPKKYSKLKYTGHHNLDLMKWKVFPRNIIIEDSVAFNKVRKNAKETITDTFDFNTTAIVYTDVWVDCHGSYYYNVLYDDCENIIVIHLIKVYGGCAGMRPRDSWIRIDKPRPDTKIEVRSYWIN